MERKSVDPEKVKVGDLVAVWDKNGKFKGAKPIKNITKKRRDIVVDFGSYTKAFDEFGNERSRNIWETESISVYDKEVKEYIKKIRCVKAAKNYMQKMIEVMGAEKYNAEDKYEISKLFLEFFEETLIEKVDDLYEGRKR